MLQQEQTCLFVNIFSNQVVEKIKSFTSNVNANIISSTGIIGTINVFFAMLSDSSISLDWHNRILSGNWNTQSLNISGSPVITAAMTYGI